MSWAQLLGFGPYYIIGFVITFFTLMSARYMLGMNIFPQERIVRVMMVSMLWLPALIVCTFLAYVKRSDKLIDAQNETDILRKQLEEAMAVINEPQDELKPKQEFTESEAEVELPKEVKPVAKEKKGFFTW